MIRYIEGDIFSSPAKVIVNTVNTVGIMGKGIALSFKNRYPNMFEQYRKECEKRNFVIGKLMLVYEKDHWILLFPTKDNWRYPSKIEYIEKGLQKFVKTYMDKQIDSIAFPHLGCGNGELNWNDVKPVMEKYLGPLPINVYIYSKKDDNNEPEHKIYKKTRDWFLEDAKSLSTNAVIDDIKYQSSLMPIELKYNDKVYNITFNKELSFTCEGEGYSFKENEIETIWEDIRESAVFTKPNDTRMRLLYELLYKLGYFTLVKIMNNKTLELEDGYQINEGKDRLYGLKED